MCTIGFNRDLNVIFKNRDKNVPTEEEIVVAANYIAVRTKGNSYYSLGFNRFGCGFVSAAINAPAWTQLVEQDRQQEAGELFIKENTGLVSPMVIISKMLPEVQSIEEWIKELIDNIKDDFRGYNIILADSHSAKSVEVFRNYRQVKTLNDKDAATNHFQAINFGPVCYEDYPNSFDRYQYAKEMLNATATIEDIFRMLKPSDTQKQKRIWRQSRFFTVSTSVIDLFSRCLYYSRKLDDDYREIILSDKKNKEVSINEPNS